MWKVNWSAWQAVWDNESFRQESNPVGQESNRSPDVREVMGSIPVRDGFFSLPHARVMLVNSPFKTWYVQ